MLYPWIIQKAVGVYVQVRPFACFPSPEAFSDTVRQYQAAFMLGSLIFGSVPGLIADRTGEYGLFYGLLAVLGVFSLIVIQICYRKRQRS